MCGPRRALLQSRPGYSLLEVMVVVAILGIAVTLSGPSVSSMIAGQQARQVVRGLVTDVGAIRAEAFIESRSVQSDAIQARLLDKAPDGWRLETSQEVAVSPSGYCTPGRIIVESPGGRRWNLQVSEGACAIERGAQF